MSEKITIVAIAISFLLFLSHLFPPYNSKNTFFAGIMFCISGLLNHFYWISTQYIYEQPHGFMIYVPLLLLLGPFLYGYFKFSTVDLVPTKAFLTRHFSLPILITLFLLPVYALPSQEKLILLDTMYSGTIPLPFLLFSWACGLILGGYCMGMIWQQKELFKGLSQSSPLLLKGLLLVNLGFITVVMISMLSVVHVLASIQIGMSVFSSIFLIIFFVHNRYPTYFQSWLTIVQESYQGRSYLEGKDREKLSAELIRLFEEEEWHLNSELGHADLAQALGLTKYQLSQLLTEEFEMKFSELLNKYRVEASKLLLIENDWMTTSAIAYAVGFKSFSSFNTAFKKRVGKSPGQFRKSEKPA